MLRLLDIVSVVMNNATGGNIILSNDKGGKTGRRTAALANIETPKI